MSTTTANLQLKKPAMSDQIRTTITDIANNLDIIDASLADIANKAVYAKSFLRQGNETDDTARMQRAIDSVSGKGTLIFTEDYVINSKLNIPNGVSLQGRGGTITVNSKLSTAIEFTGGTDIQLPSLANDIGKTTTLQFSSAHNLSIGDIVLIYNPTTYSWSGSRDYYRAGEMCEVAEIINSTTVRLTKHTYRTYTASSVQLYKLGMNENITLRDLKFVASDNGTLTTDALVRINKGKNIAIENCTLNNSSTYCIGLVNCYGGKIDNIKVKNSVVPIVTATNYPIYLSSCQNINVSNCILDSRRHGIGITSGAGYTFPCRNITVDKCLLSGNQTIPGADVHGNAEHILYTNCEIYGGAQLAGSNVKYSNCRIFQGESDSIINFVELKDGYFHVDNCKLHTSNVYGTFRGIIDLDGDTTVMLAYATGDIDIKITNNELFSDTNTTRLNGSVADYLLRAKVYGGTGSIPSNVNVDVEITDNDFSRAALANRTKIVFEAISSPTKFCRKLVIKRNKLNGIYVANTGFADNIIIEENTVDSLNNVSVNANGKLTYAGMIYVLAGTNVICRNNKTYNSEFASYYLMGVTDLIFENNQAFNPQRFNNDAMTGYGYLEYTIALKANRLIARNNVSFCDSNPSARTRIRYVRLDACLNILFQGNVPNGAGFTEATVFRFNSTPATDNIVAVV